jgi:hypothetical protein
MRDIKVKNEDLLFGLANRAYMIHTLPTCKFQAAYEKAGASIQQLIDLLAA